MQAPADRAASMQDALEALTKVIAGNRDRTREVEERLREDMRAMREDIRHDIRDLLAASMQGIHAKIDSNHAAVWAKLKDVCDQGGREHDGFDNRIRHLERRRDRDDGRQAERRAIWDGVKGALGLVRREWKTAAIALLGLHMVGGWVADALPVKVAERPANVVAIPKRLPTP